MTQSRFATKVEGGARLAVRIQPNAGRNHICEVVDDELRIRIAAPPVDSVANRELIRFLAKSLRCPKYAIQLVRGEKSRHKLLEIRGLAVGQIVAAMG